MWLKNDELIVQEKFGCLGAMDGKTELQMNSFETPKIRLLRSLYVEGSDGMQVRSYHINIKFF